LHDNDEEVRSRSEDAIKRIRDNFFPQTKKAVKKAG
jgi:hypothetical protein